MVLWLRECGGMLPEYERTRLALSILRVRCTDRHAGTSEVVRTAPPQRSCAGCAHEASQAAAVVAIGRLLAAFAPPDRLFHATDDLWSGGAI